eukprot:m.832032 g.832032  ORF g.832032 m.832032 type:complete len:112 (-) comp23432_c0_seq2:1055-1390(-)
MTRTTMQTTEHARYHSSLLPVLLCPPFASVGRASNGFFVCTVVVGSTGTSPLVIVLVFVSASGMRWMSALLERVCTGWGVSSCGRCVLWRTVFQVCAVALKQIAVPVSCSM